MININRNNYEEYFIDFLDGNLSQSEENAVLLFLDQNTDLKDELGSYQGELVLDEEISYSHKQELKKEAILSGTNATNFDELCIASLENDLNDTEEKKFAEYLKENEEKQKEYDLFKLTHVEKDASIVCPDISRLKKKAFSFKRNYYAISVAATIIILIAIYLLLPKQNIDKTILENQIAEVSKDSNPQLVDQVENESSNEIELNKIELINNNKLQVNNQLLKIELKDSEPINTENIIDNHEPQIAKLSPTEINYNFKNDARTMHLAEVRIEKVLLESNSEEKNYLTIRGFLASAFNERVLNKKEKDKVELFDIAQAGVKGINKITGSNMRLERKYDENGIPDKTEFTSNLIAFSAPIKKDK